MPMQLWGTCSVADHLDVRALIADILLYDRLIIPCPPPDEAAYDEWCRKGWKPTAQASVLRIISGLYEPVFWNDEKRAKYRKFNREQQPEQDAVDPNQEVSTTETYERAKMELYAYRSTREYLAKETGFMLFERYNELPEGFDPNDIKIIPTYRSAEAFLKEFVISRVANGSLPEQFPSSDRHREYYYMIARDLVIPRDVDPEQALIKAVELAKDATYQRDRRLLHDEIDRRMVVPASTFADRQLLADKIARVNEIAANKFKTDKHLRVVTCGKVALNVVKAVATHDPYAAGAAWLEATGYASKPSGLATEGEYAMFHDIMRALGLSQLGLAQ